MLFLKDFKLIHSFIINLLQLTLIFLVNLPLNFFKVKCLVFRRRILLLRYSFIFHLVTSSWISLTYSLMVCVLIVFHRESNFSRVIVAILLWFLLRTSDNSSFVQIGRMYFVVCFVFGALSLDHLQVLLRILLRVVFRFRRLILLIRVRTSSVHVSLSHPRRRHPIVLSVG